MRATEARDHAVDRCRMEVPVAARAQASATALAAPARGIDVVLVEDDERLADVLRRALREDGAVVHWFTDAETALARCRQQPPDLMLLDLELPGLSGFDAARLLRSHAPTARVPILVSSGHSDPASRIAAWASGADCVLVKPFELRELRAAVASLASRGRALQDLEDGWDVLATLAHIVDLRCLDARGHMERCARLARAFGSLLGLDGKDLLALERSGYLHDIGKVGVPVEVLNKPGPLTPEERLIMQEHPVVGARICSHLSTLERVVPVIRHHHERFDGTGYPDRLAGTDIPLLARVFQVVDIFEALISPRCYKAPMPAAEALATLRREAAQGAWDPGLVARFEQAVRDGGWSSLGLPA
jgi:putative two-component system response regulator